MQAAASDHSRGYKRIPADFQLGQSEEWGNRTPQRHALRQTSKPIQVRYHSPEEEIA